MKKQKRPKINREPSVVETQVVPHDSIQYVNNYGTYNIQPTADTPEMYPAIAQGFNKKIIETDREHKDASRYTENRE